MLETPSLLHELIIAGLAHVCWTWPESSDPFYVFLGPQPISGMGEARHFKFDMQTTDHVYPIAGVFMDIMSWNLYKIKI